MRDKEHRDIERSDFFLLIHYGIAMRCSTTRAMNVLRLLFFGS